MNNFPMVYNGVFSYRFITFMSIPNNALELLAPAKNADFGIEAILHGADAVYIGGPSFGARSKVGNSIADIERLCAFAHQYQARVLITLNTLLKDEELEKAVALAWQCYEVGADALIIQDMGLLEMALPPMALHASTQADIRSPQKAKFLEEVGFSQIVLARELSLPEIREIAAVTQANLEFFVHGALCVGYSGLCNLSHAQTGRSANRGECSQPCRLPYSLFDAEGACIAKNRHLLSLKDNNQSQNLRALIEAGIRSFKIEGRLKDLAYVKNVTAYYRALLDDILTEQPELSSASVGKSVCTFVPDVEKTFNRGFTDYFVRDRQDDIGAFDSPKFAGEPIGVLQRADNMTLIVETTHQLNNGDGISFFTETGELSGVRINRVEKVSKGYRLFLAGDDHKKVAVLKLGTRLYRNHDQAFENAMQGKTAERRVAIGFSLSASPEGYVLTATDEAGVSAAASIACEKQLARDQQRGRAVLIENLGKLGATLYTADDTRLEGELSEQVPFIPPALVNGLRRAVIEKLDEARKNAYQRPPRIPAVEPPVTYPEQQLGYLGNVLNSKARMFYEKYGVQTIGTALEGQAKPSHGKPATLMFAKHCLRYSFGLCPKQVKGVRPEPMLLKGSGATTTFRLDFDCKACEMKVSVNAE